MSVVQIILQIYMKGSVETTLTLVYWLQLTKSVSLFHLKQPANGQLYMGEISKFVDGDYLKAEYLIKLLGIDFDVSDVIDGVSAYASVKKTQEEDNEEELDEEELDEEEWLHVIHFSKSFNQDSLDIKWFNG